MRILIFGCGAIGSAFGGFLSRTEHEIFLYGRPWHLGRIRLHGLKVEGIWGRHTFRRFHLFTDLGKLARRKPFDLVLLTVKAFDTERAAKELRKIVSKSTLILSIQNGLGNIETLQRIFLKENVLAARVIFGVEIWPGKIKITVWADRVLVGETAVKKVTLRVRELAHLFTGAGIPAKAARDIRIPIWSKVIYNCALNPLASLLEVHYGALVENPFTRRLMENIIQEAYEVAGRMKLKLEPQSAGAYRRLFFRRLVPATYDHHPSMLQDLRKGRSTEIDALNGALLRLGKRVGVPTPVNEFLTYVMKAKEGTAI